MVRPCWPVRWTVKSSGANNNRQAGRYQEPPQRQTAVIQLNPQPAQCVIYHCLVACALSALAGSRQREGREGARKAYCLTGRATKEGEVAGRPRAWLARCKWPLSLPSPVPLPLQPPSSLSVPSRNKNRRLWLWCTVLYPLSPPSTMSPGRELQVGGPVNSLFLPVTLGIGDQFICTSM